MSWASIQSFLQAKEGSHEHGDEQQSSKEITPEKDEVWFHWKFCNDLGLLDMYFCRKYSFPLLFTTVIFYQVEKEEIEYVPAPPPKTNPWKKPVVEPVPEKSSKPSSEATAKTVEITQEKLKPEKSKVVAESKQHQATISKSNPWKKLEKSSKAVDESVGAEEEDGAERKGERG